MIDIIRVVQLIFIIYICTETCGLIQFPPRIVKQPSTAELVFQVATENNKGDKPFILECEALGEPAPQYKWTKNGIHFDWKAYDDRITQQLGRGTLVISNPRDEDIGSYQCFAYNDWGVATSNSVIVRKAELNPYLNTSPITIFATEGEPLELTCWTPYVWPKPDVAWLIQYSSGGIRSINNSRITQDPDGNLWFSNVTRNDKSDDFRYTCTVPSNFIYEYKLEYFIELVVLLRDVSAPLNKQEPQKQYVSKENEVALQGKYFKFYCIYGGIPLPQIVWSKDGKVIHSDTDRINHGNYGKSLIINYVTFEDEGNYTCEASNDVGNAQSHSINLQVLAVPYFIIEPEIQNAAEDDTVKFKCEVSGVPEPQITWIHNGKPISESPPNPRRTVSTNSIVIDKLVKNDTGNYGCNATNSLGYIYKDVYVNVVNLAAEITQPPNDVITIDGKTITMKCRVFGVPKPVVKWTRNDMGLTGGRYVVLDNGDLKIQAVNFNDAGKYTCYAWNRFGKNNAFAFLYIKEKTRIILAPEDQEAVAGRYTTFNCNAVSDDTLSLQIDWLINGELINSERDPRFIISAHNSLTISKTTELDSGTYTCVAKTELDEATAQASLIVQDVPNAPEIAGIICNEKNANIRWIYMGDNRAPILYYTIYYNTSFTPNMRELAHDFIPPSNFSGVVSLGPWTNYTFFVVGYNKVGPSLPSKHSSVCLTQSDVPYKNPEYVEGKGIEPNNLVISWRTMPQIDHNGPKFQYRVFYKRDIPSERYSVVDIMNWTHNSYIVNNVPTFQQYRIKVIAMNELGQTNLEAKEVIGFSGENVPLKSPWNFDLVQIHGPREALISWDPVPLESVRGHFKGYKIHIWTDNDKENNHRYNSDTNYREIYVRNDVTKVVVNKFIPYTKNYARIFVYNGKYNGPPSETLIIQTPEGVPGIVGSFHATPMGSSAFFLSWKKPMQPNGILTGYRIYCQEVRNTQLEPLAAPCSQINSPDVYSTKLYGLRPNTKYRLHVRATTNAGAGENYFIEQKTKALGSYVPDIPMFAWSKLPTDNGFVSVKVDWLVNPNGNPGSYFYVKYRLQGNPTFVTTNYEYKDISMEIRELSPNEDYEFKIVAVVGECETESAIQYVNTYEVGKSPPYIKWMKCQYKNRLIERVCGFVSQLVKHTSSVTNFSV